MVYYDEDLVRIAKRENNNKRSYLVVNPLQGKHIPVSPSKALEMFEQLADTLRNNYVDESVLIVGFAETATAIGAQVAISLNKQYIQTTREQIPDVEYLYFSEEHSHATEQKLVKNDIDTVIDNTDRIIFVEDEVTTGKTILNIIDILGKLYPYKLKFAVASLINGMSSENLELYQTQNIDLYYLLKTDHSMFGSIAKGYMGNGIYNESISKVPSDYKIFDIPDHIDTRRIVDGIEYRIACQKLWEYTYSRIGEIKGKSIAVIGTEELMYPALYVGKELEIRGNIVYCHATTRSPIVVSNEKEYPLHERYDLKSLYCSERRTFIYDIGSYDKVIIISDAQKMELIGVNTLVNALQTKNEDITLIRWC